MSTTEELKQRLERIESGYEFMLAYAAQGRNDDTGSALREHLSAMHAALDGLAAVVDAAVPRGAHAQGTRVFLDAVRRDADVAAGAIGFVLDRPAISSLLIDNLNASIHLRALLTDLFLIDQGSRPALTAATSSG